MEHLATDSAMIAIKEGLAEAERLGEPSCLAIVDSGGNLFAFARSNGATHGTIEIAIAKAFTSSAFRVASADLLQDMQPGGEIFGIESIRSRMSYVGIGGGLPIIEHEKCVGGIGVSGGPVITDVKIAKVMLNAFKD